MTRRRKRGLTKDQHARFGARLKLMRDALIPLPVSLAYPMTSPVQRKMRKAIEALDALRCALDGQAAHDLDDDFDTQLYYPGQLADPDSEPGGNLATLMFGPIVQPAMPTTSTDAMQRNGSTPQPPNIEAMSDAQGRAATGRTADVGRHRWRIDRGDPMASRI